MTTFLFVLWSSFIFQHVRTQLMKNGVEQSGVCDELCKETESSPLYPLHRFRIREESKSLYIEIQNKKTKRVFSNTFSKSTLESMKLHGSIQKIIQMINSAKSGKSDKLQFKFELLFSDPKNDKISINNMSKSYSKGRNCMHMVISVDEFFMSGVWPFKLLEQEREETDVLRDIIEDLQDEIVELKEKLQAAKMNPMVVWKSSKATGNQVKWDVETLQPTLQGLAKRENNNEDIVIGIGGWYRVSIR
eukprot:322088_1